jgi:hypothetical protein
MGGTAKCHRHLLAPRETVQLEFMVGDLHARVLSAWLRVQTPKGTQGQDTYIVLWLSTPITCRVQLWCGCRLAHACRKLNTSSLWIVNPHAGMIMDMAHGTWHMARVSDERVQEVLDRSCWPMHHAVNNNNMHMVSACPFYSLTRLSHKPWPHVADGTHRQE